MTLFDLIAIVTVLISVLGGVNAGGVRELVGLSAFVLALGGAVLLLPLTRPIALAAVQPGWAAGAAALAVAFLVIYFGLQFGGRAVSARLRASGGALGALDRVGGGGVGLVRAGVLLGGAYLIYQAVIPAEARPPWIEHAAMLPVARAAGGMMQGVAPKGVAQAGALAPLFRDAVTGGAARDRSTLNEVIEDEPDSTAPAGAGKPDGRSGGPGRRAPRRGGLEVTRETSR